MFLFVFSDETVYFFMTVLNLATPGSRQNHRVILKKTKWFIYSKSVFFCAELCKIATTGFLVFELRIIFMARH